MSSPLIDQLSGMKGRPVQVRTARVTSVSPLRVDYLESDIPQPGFRLARGDLVLMVVDRGSARITQRISQRPIRGTVTAVGASTATVSTSVGSMVMEWLGALAPAVGNQVGLLWGDTTGYIAGVLSSSQVPTPDPTPDPTPTDLTPAILDSSTSAADADGVATSDLPPATPAGDTVVAVATSVATSEAGVWLNRQDALQSSLDASTPVRSGWAFYGQPWGPGACIGLRLTLVRGLADRVGADAPITAHVRLHPATTKTGTVPTPTADAGVDVPGFNLGTTTTVDLPLAWGQRMIDSGGGVCLIEPTTATDYGQWIGPQSGDVDGFLLVMDIDRDGVPVPNLIPNGGPIPTGYTAQPTTQGDVYPADNVMPNTETPTWWYEGVTVTYAWGIQYHTYFPHNAPAYWSLRIVPDTPAGDWKVFPVLGGTQAIPVAAGSSYTLSVDANNPGMQGSVRAGFRWYDATGAAISDAAGAFAVLPNQQDTGVGWDNLSTSGGVTTIVPDDTSYITYVGSATATLTAPAGAAFAAPYAECNSTMSGTTYISNLTMTEA